ncbi:hypothetical protein GCM10020331_008890 [Ectobacillus funiculus]
MGGTDTMAKKTNMIKYSGIVMTEKGPFIFLIAIEIFIPIIRSIIIVRAILKKKR